MTDDSYEVRDGFIVSPGRFEGQRDYMPAAYNQYLDGFCNDDGKTVTVEIFLNARWQTVRFIQDDQGFVREV